MSERYIESYDCEDDDGNRYEVHLLQEFGVHRPLQGPPQEVPGRKSLRLASGAPVNYIDERTFKLVQNDAIIRRVD